MDGVVRVAASRWNKGDRYGPLGRVFFNMLTLERHRLWHYDTDGIRVITSVRRRIPVMERYNLMMDKKKKWIWLSVGTSC